ncbi:hypothetical protein [Halobellus sp. EA9]|uniref:hypothetical protein n=1 Tax=Halobellus sp. EA9 TaxID=3421647 RepID=UPI003EBF095F
MTSYTYEWYRDFLLDLRDRGYDFIKYRERPAAEPWVLLRHDVDYDPEKALEIAEIEHEMDISSTFFVLVTADFYNALSESVGKTFRKIDRLGHDIGLHFDTGRYWEAEPNPQELQTKVRSEQTALRALGEFDIVETIAFHNPPSWTLDRQFDGIESTYEPEFFGDIKYESDSLHRWREEPPLQDGKPSRLQILTHPVLWGESDECLEHRIISAQRRLLDRADKCVVERTNIKWDPTNLTDVAR